MISLSQSHVFVREVLSCSNFSACYLLEVDAEEFSCNPQRKRGPGARRTRNEWARWSYRDGVSWRHFYHLNLRKKSDVCHRWFSCLLSNEHADTKMIMKWNPEGCWDPQLVKWCKHNDRKPFPVSLCAIPRMCFGWLSEGGTRFGDICGLAQVFCSSLRSVTSQSGSCLE